MSKPLRILVLEDRRSDADLMLQELQAEGIPFQTQCVDNEKDFLLSLRSAPPDLVLADHGLPPFDGLSALAATRKEIPGVPFVLISDDVEEDAAVEALNRGATDIVPKDRLRRLGPILRRTLSTLEDRRHRRRAEERASEANVLLNALRSVNRLIVRERDPERLVGNACQILAQGLGYSLVWIAVGDPESKRLVSMVHGGSHVDYLKLFTGKSGEPAFQDGPVKKVLRTGQSWFCNNVASDSQFAAWKDAALASGLASLAVIPIMHAGVVFGASAFCSDKVDTFREDELILLRELADDLALALENIKKDAEKQKAEDALKNSNERLGILFEYAPDAYYLHDLQGIWVDGNRAAEDMVGCPREELIGQSFLNSDLLPPAEIEKAAARLACSARGEANGPVEYVFRRKDGRLLTAEVREYPVRIGQQALVLGIARDVTERKKTESRLAVFAELGARLNSAKNANEAAEIIVAAAEKLCDWDACSLHLCYENQDRLRCVTSKAMVEGQRIECPAAQATAQPSARVRQVLSGGAQLLSDQHATQYEDVFIENGHARPASAMLVPVRNEHEVIGLLSLRSHKAGAYDQATLQVLQSLADHCAGALERIRAQEACMESKTNYRLLVERSPDAIFLHRDGKFVFANPATAELLRAASPEAVLGRSIWDIIPEQFQDRAGQRIRECLKGGVAPVIEQEILRLDGTSLSAEVMSIPFCHQGKPAVQTIMRDITARKRAEEQIFSQAALLEVSQDAIMVQELTGQIRFWNSGANRLYGWTLEEALEQTASQIMGSPDPKQFTAARQCVLRKGEWVGELVQVTKAQREITVFSRWALVQNPDGTPRSILVVSTDITERKSLEAQLLRAQRLDCIGRLASGIAHDLNNVLTPVMMAIELLRDTRKDDSEDAMLQTLQTCVQRGAGIIQQLLLFARGAEGAKAALQPKNLIREMAEIARETFPKSIAVHVDYGRDLRPIHGDRTQMQQVLMNLCVNARDAMPKGGSLTLEAANACLNESDLQIHPKARPGNYVVFRVADTGTGISPEILEKMFDPFFTTKPVGQGTGLGLSTVLGIVESHGGFLKVESKVGSGSTFSVYLPAVDSPHPEESWALKPVQGKGHGELILVVEDEMAVREMIRNMLETFGYRVALAVDGEGALALFEKHQSEIKAVITDLFMPGLGGHDTIRHLLKLAPGLKFVAISGMSTSLDSLKAEIPQIHAVLEKPFSTPSLLAAIETVLAR